MCFRRALVAIWTLSSLPPAPFRRRCPRRPWLRSSSERGTSDLICNADSPFTVSVRALAAATVPLLLASDITRMARRSSPTFPPRLKSNDGYENWKWERSLVLRCAYLRDWAPDRDSTLHCSSSTGSKKNSIGLFFGVHLQSLSSLSVTSLFVCLVPCSTASTTHLSSDGLRFPVPETLFYPPRQSVTANRQKK